MFLGQSTIASSFVYGEKYTLKLNTTASAYA